MVNAEYWRDKILERLEYEDEGFAVVDGVPCSCIGTDCVKCDLYTLDSGAQSCSYNRILWLCEPVKGTHDD